DAEILSLSTPKTQRIDLQGKTVTPGFNDCHIHLYWYGMQLLRQADLTGSRDIAEILDRLSTQAKKSNSGWIEGHGFDQSKLKERRDQMAAYSRLHDKGKLPLRVTVMPPQDAAENLHAHGIRSGFVDDWLRVGACKLFSDGSLGAQTAWLSTPYTDKPSTRGLRIYDPQELKRRAADAQAKGFQLAIHAIGDQALRETLDAIEYALSQDR